MAKTKVNLYQLIEKYLLSIGIPKSIISLQIIPSKFENVIYSVSQPKAT